MGVDFVTQPRSGGGFRRSVPPAVASARGERVPTLGNYVPLGGQPAHVRRTWRLSPLLSPVRSRITDICCAWRNICQPNAGLTLNDSNPRECTRGRTALAFATEVTHSPRSDSRRLMRCLAERASRPTITITSASAPAAARWSSVAGRTFWIPSCLAMIEAASEWPGVKSTQGLRRGSGPGRRCHIADFPSPPMLELLGGSHDGDDVPLVPLSTATVVLAGTTGATASPGPAAGAGVPDGRPTTRPQRPRPPLPRAPRTRRSGVARDGPLPAGRGCGEHRAAGPRGGRRRSSLFLSRQVVSAASPARATRAGGRRARSSRDAAAIAA